jgi:hypothetical protein
MKTGEIESFRIGKSLRTDMQHVSKFVAKKFAELRRSAA